MTRKALPWTIKKARAFLAELERVEACGPMPAWWGLDDLDAPWPPKDWKIGDPIPVKP